MNSIMYMPTGLNGQYHYPECDIELNSSPHCFCTKKMFGHIGQLAQELTKAYEHNRRLQKVIDRTT